MYCERTKNKDIAFIHDRGSDILFQNRNDQHKMIFHINIPLFDEDTTTSKSDHAVIEIHVSFVLTRGQEEFKAQADERQSCMIKLKRIKQ
jgi:hypothetical protein